jgi:hypothetical protein
VYELGGRTAAASTEGLLLSKLPAGSHRIRLVKGKPAK